MKQQIFLEQIQPRMDTGANDVSHDFLGTQIHRCRSILTSAVDMLRMACTWLKLKQFYDWYTEMGDEEIYRWWILGSYSVGGFSIGLFLLGVESVRSWNKIIQLFCIVLVNCWAFYGPILLWAFAMKHGPHQSRMTYTLGCLPKSMAEIGILCIAIALHSAFKDRIFSCAWALFVIQLEYLWQIRYASRDFIFFDLLLELLMQILLVNRKHNDLYDFSFMVICFLCFLVIYMKNWSTPSCTTVFGKREYLRENSITRIFPNKESTARNLKEEKPTENGIP